MELEDVDVVQVHPLERSLDVGKDVLNWSARQTTPTDLTYLAVVALVVDIARRAELVQVTDFEVRLGVKCVNTRLQVMRGTVLTLVMMTTDSRGTVLTNLPRISSLTPLQ